VAVGGHSAPGWIVTAIRRLPPRVSQIVVRMSAFSKWGICSAGSAVRRHRRAQGDSSMLRSIRPTHATLRCEWITSRAGGCPGRRWTTVARRREPDRVLRMAPTLADGSEIRPGRVTRATGYIGLDRVFGAR
jgi:hypothetical protein